MLDVRRLEAGVAACGRHGERRVDVAAHDAPSAQHVAGVARLHQLAARRGAKRRIDVERGRQHLVLDRQFRVADRLQRRCVADQRQHRLAREPDDPVGQYRLVTQVREDRECVVRHVGGRDHVQQAGPAFAQRGAGAEREARVRVRRAHDAHRQHVAGPRIGAVQRGAAHLVRCIESRHARAHRLARAHGAWRDIGAGMGAGLVDQVVSQVVGHVGAYLDVQVDAHLPAWIGCGARIALIGSSGRIGRIGRIGRRPRRGQHLAARRQHGLDNLAIAGAAAQHTAQGALHLGLARLRFAPQQRLGAHQHAGGTDAALRRAKRDEGALQRRQRAVGLGQAFDRDHAAPGALAQRDDARADLFAVEQHRAGAAVACMAADLRAGESQVVAQCVGQAPQRVGVDRHRAAVHVQRDRLRSVQRRGMQRRVVARRHAASSCKARFSSVAVASSR